MTLPIWPRVGRRIDTRRARERSRFRPRAELLENRITPVAGNDMFANAYTLFDYDYSLADFNTDATGEPGEPDHAGASGVLNSLWFKWTAPAGGGTVLIYTPNSTIDTTLGVYVANDSGNPAVNDLTEVASDNSPGVDSVTFPPITGTTYYIAVDGVGTETGLVAAYVRVHHDNIADARLLVGSLDDDYSSDVVDATGEAGEPNHAGNSAPFNSVWWKWIAPNASAVTLDTSSCNWDTTLAVYTAADPDHPAVTALTLVGEDDNSGPANTSALIFTPAVGETYFIVVDGAGFAGGQAFLVLAQNVPPTADAGGPYNVLEGTNSQVQLDGRNSTDPGGTIVSFEWDFDYNGLTFDVDATGDQPIFDASGLDGPSTRTIALRVIDDDGATDLQTTTLTVLNVAPTIIDFSQDNVPDEGGAVVVRVTFTDPFADPFFVLFFFEDDGFAEDGPYFVNAASHVFEESGSYVVNVYVGDDDGGFATATTTVVVNNAAPTITSVTNDGPANEGEPATVTVAATDPAGINDPLMYEFDFDSNGTFEVGPQASNFASHTFPDNGSFTVNVRVTDDDGGATTSSTVVVVNNAAPTIIGVSNDGPVSEGNPVTVTVTATDPAGANDPLLYEFDFDNDGAFEVGPQASNSAQGIFPDNGNFTVNVRVTDGDGGVATSNTLVVANNDPPIVFVFAPARGVSGQPRDFTMGADELGPTDRAVGFTYTINWDDDIDIIIIPPTPNNGDGILVTHVFTTPGTYNVSVTATDKDNGSTTTTHQIIIVESELQGTTLAVGGSQAADKMKISPNGKTAGAIKLKMNGVTTTFAGVTQIEVYGQDGDDTITLAGSVTLPAFLSGGNGNDKLKSGKGPSVLLGGTGDDKLTSSIGRDILIGGMGVDVLKASSGEDILIGGTTDFDLKLLKLAEVMTEWTDTLEDLATRIGHLDGSVPGGLNNGNFLTTITVHDDDATDKLAGSGDTDWYFAMLAGANADRLKEIIPNETVTLLL